VMSQFYSDEARESDKWSLPDAETLYVDSPTDDLVGEDGEPLPSGWYFWFCLPGCLPDSDPIGPYDTEEEAIEACRDFAN
jgi:hypothetical protein